MPKLVLVHNDAAQSVLDILLFRASWFVNVIAMLTILYGGVIVIAHNKIKALHFLTIVAIIISYGFVFLYRIEPEWLMTPMFWNSSILPKHMPFCINLTFMAAPFYSLGIYYRLYQDKVDLKETWGKCIVVWFIYFVLLLLDRFFIHSSLCFAVNTMVNVPLVYLYSFVATIGIIILSKLVSEIRAINYIGRNSIIFYFLNALMLRVVTLVVSKFHLAPILSQCGYFAEILVAVLAVIATFPVVWFIKKYLPFVVGDKESFNKLSQKVGLNIKW